MKKLKEGYDTLSVSIRKETLKKFKGWCSENGAKINRKTEMLIEAFLKGEKK